MTGKTPDSVWISDIGWDLQSVEGLEALGFAWSRKHGKNPREFIPADLHAAVVAERDQLEEAVNELLIVWQNDGSVGDLDLVKLHATIKSIETSRTELEKHHA